MDTANVFTQLNGGGSRGFSYFGFSDSLNRSRFDGIRLSSGRPVDEGESTSVVRLLYCYLVRWLSFVVDLTRLACVIISHELCWWLIHE